MKSSIMRDNLKIIIVLTVIALVSALLLSGLYMITYVSPEEEFKTKIAKLHESNIESTIDTSSYENMESTVIEKVVRFEDKSFGMVVLCKKSNDSVYSSKGLRLFVVVNDAKIVKIEVYETNETPGLGSKATGADYIYNFINSDTADYRRETTPTDIDVDAVSGATKSSNGVKRAVTASAVFYEEVLK